MNSVVNKSSFLDYTFSFLFLNEFFFANNRSVFLQKPRLVLLKLPKFTVLIIVFGLEMFHPTSFFSESLLANTVGGTSNAFFILKHM